MIIISVAHFKFCPIGKVCIMPSHSKCKGKSEGCEVTPGMCLFAEMCVGNGTVKGPNELVCKLCSEEYNSCTKCGDPVSATC
jgi:hypothetical protein